MSQRRPRLVDPGYLNWLRGQRCACGCGRQHHIEAAHLRASSIKHDKPYTGMGRKPDDKWALPLHQACHLRQHAHGDELGWWSAHGIDPFALAISYYKRYGGDGGKPYRKPKRRRAHLFTPHPMVPAENRVGFIEVDDPVKQRMADAIKEREKMHKRLQRAKRKIGGCLTAAPDPQLSLVGLASRKSSRRAKIPSRPFPKQQRGLRG